MWPSCKQTWRRDSCSPGQLTLPRVSTFPVPRPLPREAALDGLRPRSVETIGLVNLDLGRAAGRKNPLLSLCLN
jgi:hypothetical protein